MKEATNTTISKEQLHTNYVRLAKMLHPDCNPSDPDADKKFQELQDQYNKAQKILETKSHYQASITISLREAIEGTERYFVTDDNHRYVLSIPAGIKNNQTIQFKGVEVSSNSNAVLHIKVMIDLQTKFSIIGDHLILGESVPFWKLLRGGDHQIIGPDGRKIPVKIPPKTNKNKMFMVKGAGLYNLIDKKREPLYIRFFGSII